MSIATDPLYPVRKTLKTGNRKAAQRSLRVLLRHQPSAEAWMLAAQSCHSNDEAIYCLRQALALEPRYSRAQHLLLRLEAAPPRPVLPPPKPRIRRRTVIVFGLLLCAAVLSIITLNLAGLITGPITAVTQLTGGDAPVHEINGQPLSQIENAPLLVPPSQTLPLPNQMIDMIEPGYVHDFTFEAETGADVAIYVQFLSVAATRVSRNVVVLRPDGSDATPACDRDAILEGDNNVTYICTIDSTGTWIVRVLGREQESVGAFFIGEQMMK